MPDLFPITSNVFPGLLERLGVRLTQPRAPLWELSSIVQPVSIVDANITLQATVDPGVQLFATEGVLSNPAVNALLADTGQLEAGNWEFVVWLSAGVIDISQIVDLEHRNALNSSANWEHHLPLGFPQPVIRWSELVLQDERIRLRNLTTSSAVNYSGIIWRRLLV